jgi:hypothetical protein
MDVVPAEGGVIGIVVGGLGVLLGVCAGLRVVQVDGVTKPLS